MKVGSHLKNPGGKGAPGHYCKPVKTAEKDRNLEIPSREDSVTVMEITEPNPSPSLIFMEEKTTVGKLLLQLEDYLRKKLMT